MNGEFSFNYMLSIPQKTTLFLLLCRKSEEVLFTLYTESISDGDIKNDIDLLICADYNSASHFLPALVLIQILYITL